MPRTPRFKQSQTYLTFWRMWSPLWVFYCLIQFWTKYMYIYILHFIRTQFNSVDIYPENRKAFYELIFAKISEQKQKARWIRTHQFIINVRKKVKNYADKRTCILHEIRFCQNTYTTKGLWENYNFWWQGGKGGLWAA